MDADKGNRPTIEDVIHELKGEEQDEVFITLVIYLVLLNFSKISIQLFLAWIAVSGACSY